MFENVGTAPAQRVAVVDSLLSTLDPSTVRLSAFTFGDQVVLPPPGLSSYYTRVDLRPAHNLMVDITAGVNPVTGVLSWQFTSIDPATGQVLDPGSLDGFLPPNHVPPEGEGSVLFTISPNAQIGGGAT